MTFLSKQICCIFGETKTFPNSDQYWISHNKRTQIFKYAVEENKAKHELGQHTSFMDNTRDLEKGHRDTYLPIFLNQ